MVTPKNYTPKLRFGIAVISFCIQDLASRPFQVRTFPELDNCKVDFLREISMTSKCV